MVADPLFTQLANAVATRVAIARARSRFTGSTDPVSADRIRTVLRTRRGVLGHLTVTVRARARSTIGRASLRVLSRLAVLVAARRRDTIHWAIAVGLAVG